MANKAAKNIRWHQLKVGDTVQIKMEEDSEEFHMMVLSFRKMMAITLCDTNRYELFDPEEFNSFCSAVLVSKRRA